MLYLRDANRNKNKKETHFAIEPLIEEVLFRLLASDEDLQRRYWGESLADSTKNLRNALADAYSNGDWEKVVDYGKAIEESGDSLGYVTLLYAEGRSVAPSGLIPNHLIPTKGFHPSLWSFRPFGTFSSGLKYDNKNDSTRTTANIRNPRFAPQDVEKDGMSI